LLNLILIKTTIKKQNLKMFTNLNLLIETILVLFAILTSNGIIYSFTFFNGKNSSENISVIRNNSAKDGLALTSLIASNPINLTSSDSSTSNTLSLTSSDSSASYAESLLESSISDNLSVTSLGSNGSDIIDNIEDLLGTTYRTLDSVTILDRATFLEWNDRAMSFQDLPFNTPLNILHSFKFEELKILYSQDLIQYSVSQTELRLIIEHFPATSLFAHDFNHLILTMMSYYHFTLVLPPIF